MKFLRVATLTAFMVGLHLVPAWGQYPFGKNKVIYQSRDWKVLRTEHVDIYHYPEEKNLVLYLAPLVEDTYAEYSETFDMEFRGRVPFVFYASHYDFQQTNILPYMISESTGGFTDLMKGRIAVPFTGQYASFRHVVRHEMVHAFMLEKLAQVMKAQGRVTYSHPPLWFVEGMAEHFADAPQNTQGNMFVRDALLSNRLPDLIDIWRIHGSFMMYKEGEAVLNYIATSFGDRAVIEILENWWVADDFSGVLRNTIGMDLAELSDAFTRYIKRRYYPSVMDKSFANDIGTQITRPRTFHSRPTNGFDSEGRPVVYSLCAGDGVINICSIRHVRAGREDGYEHKTVVRGGRSPDLESIPAFRSKLEARGDTLLFVSKAGRSDRIYLWDMPHGREFLHVEFDDLALLSSPTLSPDGKRVAFAALDDRGQQDLFVYHLDDGRRERLTDDGFSEEDPDFHPRDDVLLFSSDRSSAGHANETHIYQMDLATRAVAAIEGGAHADSNPEWMADGDSFLFVSDREGAFNVYRYLGVDVVRQTNAIGGVTAPSADPNGTGFVASVYGGGEFALYHFEVHDGVLRQMAAVPPDSAQTEWYRTPYSDKDLVSQDYKTRFSVDFVGVGISVDPDFGEVGNGGQMVMTDILGNHQIGFAFGTTTDDVNDFWKNFNAAVTYTNLSHRVNYSVSGFNFNSVGTGIDFDSREEKRVGAAASASYPLNRFDRVDATVVGRRITRARFGFIDQPSQESFTGSLFATWVSDRVLWTFGGPVTGWRYYVTAGATADFQGNAFGHEVLQLDVRRYIKVAPRVVLAGRYTTRNTWGADDQLYYLGGPWSLRGYRYREFFGRTLHLLNAELRFPLLDGFALSLPFGVIEMPMFRGALFLDAGKTDRNDFDVFDTGWLGSIGLGLELNLGYAPVARVNFTRKTDFATISPDTGFEIFIGYNY